MTDDERMPPPADPPTPGADVPGRPPTPGADVLGRPPTPGAADAAIVSAVTPDVELARESSPLPGAHRGGFHRLPTAPVAVTVESAPSAPEAGFAPAAAWAVEEPALQRGLAGWALAFAVIGLVVSLFVGWGFPIGLVAVVSAVIALRRPLESRAVAVWAIALGVASILYSAGWLVFAAMRAGILE